MNMGYDKLCALEVPLYTQRVPLKALTQPIAAIH